MIKPGYGEPFPTQYARLIDWLPMVAHIGEYRQAYLHAPGRSAGVVRMAHYLLDPLAYIEWRGPGHNIYHTRAEAAQASYESGQEEIIEAIMAGVEHD